MPIPDFLDLDTLRVIWWLLLGVLLMGFAIMDGFDMGVATLLPFVAKNDEERRIVINTVGPVWEGNQVWLILGAGAIFAAWPMVYAVAFSSFYIAMFVILLALILRPPAFKFRSKIESPTWRNAWDWILFISGFLPALLFGVAVGNVMQGIPFFIDDNMHMFYRGSFWELLNPFALGCGIISLAMMTQHGALYLGIKTKPPLQMQGVKIIHGTTLLILLTFSMIGLYSSTTMTGYKIATPLLENGPSNPLLKEVSLIAGYWGENYTLHSWMRIPPLLGYMGIVATWIYSMQERFKLAFVTNAVAMAGIIGTAGVSMYPFILPSSLDPKSSLTIWDASSSRLTLFVMLLATVIFLPIIVVYTRWVYKILSGKVTSQNLQDEENSY